MKEVAVLYHELESVCTNLYSMAFTVAEKGHSNF